MAISEELERVTDGLDYPLTADRLRVALAAVGQPITTDAAKVEEAVQVLNEEHVRTGKVITRNIAVYDSQDTEVRLLADRDFDGNYSAALRFIIRKYTAVWGLAARVADGVAQAG
jgi:hypothetical protein